MSDSEDKIPTEFLGGKQAIMEIVNGPKTSQLIKIVVIVALIAVLSIVIVTRDWSTQFRESAVSAEIQRSNVERLNRIEQNMERMRREFATRESQDQIERRLDRMENKVDLLVDYNRTERGR